jgi:hypothetical protein
VRGRIAPEVSEIDTALEIDFSFHGAGV